MQLYERMIFNIARQAVEECDYRAIGVFLNEFAYTECYNILKRIYNILRDESLKDEDCYAKIELIMDVFKSRNLDVGHRHKAFTHQDLEWMHAEEEDAEDLFWS